MSFAPPMDDPADAPLEADAATMAAAPREPGPSSPSGDDPTLISGESPSSDHQTSARIPTHIGRYVVLKPIGEGGMGLVFAAYDPELDRKIAVKLVRPGASADLDRRLLREAQALAKLSHPNIIHVYEVGALRDGVFIAMEYFEGPTLKRWQDRSDVTRREVLAAYRAAGRGLEAAHAAGLVHRDFKAENVLVGADGQVRVIDFGLARDTLFGSPGPEPGETSAAPLDVQPAVAITALTKTGAIMGTPAYMAPEQYAGSNVDARTDQFSFCVSLYEALYGERPFAGKTIAELTHNVLHGIVQPPPRFEQVPAWIRRALLRGLSVKPEQRHPSLEHLLAELGRDPAVRRRRVLVSVAVVGLMIVAVLLIWDRVTEAQRARAEGERLRVEFGRTRASNAEDELHRLRTRTATQRWDDLVLAWASDRVDDDPTRALASLRHLQDLDANLDAARTIAADAWHRGVARESIGLSGDVLELAVAPADDFVATLTTGGVVHAWSRTHRAQLPAWDCPEAATALAVAPHAPTLAVGSKSGTIFLVELGREAIEPFEPVEPVEPFTAHAGAVTALAFSTDGSVLASAGADHAVRRWTTAGEKIDAMTNHDAEVVALSYDLGGTALASATITGQLAWWDPQTAKVRKIEVQGGRGMKQLVAAHGTAWAVAGDGRVSRWRPGSQPHQTQFADVVSLQVTSDEDLVFVHQDGSVTWSDGDPDVPPRPLHVGAAVTHVAHSPDDGGIWLAGPEIGVRRWDATPDYARAVPFEGSVTALAFSPDGSLLAAAGATGTLEILRGQDSTKVELAGRPVRVSWSPTGEQLAVAFLDGSIEVLDPRAPESKLVRFTGDESSELVERSNGVPHPALAWTDDGAALAFARCPGENTCIHALLDIGTGELRGRPVFTSFVPALDPNDDGTSLLIADGSSVIVSDVATTEHVESNFIGDDQRILGQAWSDEGDGRVRIATADGETLRVWSWQPTSEQHHLVLEESGFSALSPSDDATAVYLGSKDKLAALWSIAGTRFLPIPELPSGVEHIRLSDDGRTLLARGRNDDGDGFAFVLDLAIGRGRRLPGLLDPVALSVDGVVADQHHGSGIRIWDEPTPEDAAGFRTWLEQATTIEVGLQDLRGGD